MLKSSWSNQEQIKTFDIPSYEHILGTGSNRDIFNIIIMPSICSRDLCAYMCVYSFVFFITVRYITYVIIQYIVVTISCQYKQKWHENKNDISRRPEQIYYDFYFVLLQFLFVIFSSLLKWFLKVLTIWRSLAPIFDRPK